MKIQPHHLQTIQADARPLVLVRRPTSSRYHILQTRQTRGLLCDQKSTGTLLADYSHTTRGARLCEACWLALNPTPGQDQQAQLIT